MESAGLSAFDSKGYLHDFTRAGFSVSEKQLHSLLAMDWQAQRIKSALAQASPWEALVQEFIELRKLESELCRSGQVERHTLQGKLIRLTHNMLPSGDPFLHADSAIAVDESLENAVHL